MSSGQPNFLAAETASFAVFSAALLQHRISAALLMGGFLFAFVEERHRALQDFLGGSVVVQIRQKTWFERIIMRFLGAVLLAAFGWVAYSQFFASGSLLQQFYIRRAEEHLGKIALLEEAHYTYYGSYTNDLLRLSLLSGDPVQFQRDTQKVLFPKDFKIGGILDEEIGLFRNKNPGVVQPGFLCG